MAIPKKIRTITVDEVEYYYTVKLEYYGMTIQTNIGIVENQHKRFCLVARQGDPNLKDVERDRIGVITPRLIARSIKFVLENTAWTTTILRKKIWKKE